jgi:hypothetical protein
VVRHGHVVPAVPRRPAAELLRQAGVDRLPNSRHAVVVDEELHARSPAVVGRPDSVIAENVGTRPEQRSGVLLAGEQRRNDLLVERAGQLDAGDEARHAGD